MDITIAEFIKLISVFLDIPIKSYNNHETSLIHLLHVIFSLFGELQNFNFKGNDNNLALAANC